MKRSRFAPTLGAAAIAAAFGLAGLSTAQAQETLDQSRSVWNRSCLSPTWAARFPDGSSLHTSIGSESAMGGGFGGFPAV
jgi:hypothetical protein